MYASREIWPGTSCMPVTKFDQVLHVCQSRNLTRYFMYASHEIWPGTSSRDNRTPKVKKSMKFKLFILSLLETKLWVQYKQLQDVKSSHVSLIYLGFCINTEIFQRCFNISKTRLTETWLPALQIRLNTSARHFCCNPWVLIVIILIISWLFLVFWLFSGNCFQTIQNWFNGINDIWSIKGESQTSSCGDYFLHTNSDLITTYRSQLEQNGREKWTKMLKEWIEEKLVLELN